MYQKFLNESIKFLFIGQGQVDTWHHLRSLLEPSSPRNLERKKIRFRTSPNKFAQLCEVENASTLILSSWSISHDCVISVFNFPMVCCSQSPFYFILHDCANFSYVHAKLKNMVFQLLLVISPMSFSWFHFNYLQINSKYLSKPMALLISLCI